jgi:type III restriction enzyme
MAEFEVPEPIICSPYEEPSSHWYLREGEPAERRHGRRPAMYFYRAERSADATAVDADAGVAIELKLVNLIRERVRAWREAGWPNVTGTTLELFQYWRRDGRGQRLFFAQLEAAETIVFLNEARRDFLQGITIPLDEPSDRQQEYGAKAFRRHACKMATGSGKTTVMGMLAAWTILNKVHAHADRRFSDVVLIVCPNVTIRSRLSELDPKHGEASLYRTRDLVPPHLMADLAQGRVLVTNWHVFEPQSSSQAGGVSAKVVKTGVRRRVHDIVYIGAKTTTARGRRYLTPEQYREQVNAGLLEVLDEEVGPAGELKYANVILEQHVESDAAVLTRVLGRDVGSKRNILVFNDEAHHAYRIRRDEADPDDIDAHGDQEAADLYYKEATVWIEGLDRVNALRGINFCVDLSATPYFLGRVGQEANRPFPWIVSDFPLTDAIESGLVKIPQLAVRDATGRSIPGYFNIWRWILPQLSPAERGGKKGTPKPEAILKYANTPIAMLAGLWAELKAVWAAHDDDRRPPVFIIVCANTAIAKVVYGWLAENEPPMGIPALGIPELLNSDNRRNTIRVDSKVVSETDSGEVKSAETQWLRFTLDTVGKTEWPSDRVGRPIYPEGFEELARQRPGAPLHPPGRDVRCIVSVGMLTEGWDCNTVTHIVGLRPFMSQLLCEQVVGRGLRRRSYDVREVDGRELMTEEVAKVFGVPFQVVPFKANPTGVAPPPVLKRRVHALPERTHLAIEFPRVEGYRQAIRNRISVDWSRVPPLWLDPDKIPPEVEVKASLPTNTGRPSLMGPGRHESLDLNPYRKGRRVQALVFEMAKDLTREYVKNDAEIPAHALFPQLVSIIQKYVDEKVVPIAPAVKVDLYLSPYYGWALEQLVSAIQPDTARGEAPEVPRYESNRPPGSTADVDYWTSKDVREVIKSHVNYVVADTKLWEQSAAYILDTHPAVQAFVKNSGLGLAVPYLHNGQTHDYLPDFVVRLRGAEPRHLLLETKGFDPLAEVKAAAAARWVSAVNSDDHFGRWEYRMVRSLAAVREVLGELKADS